MAFDGTYFEETTFRRIEPLGPAARKAFKHGPQNLQRHAFDHLYEEPPRSFRVQISSKLPKGEYPEAGPFGNGPLLKSIGSFVFNINKVLDKDNQIAVHIPDRYGRTVFIHGDNPLTVHHVKGSIDAILDSYVENRHDENFNLHAVAAPEAKRTKRFFDCVTAFTSASFDQAYKKSNQAPPSLSSTSIDIIQITVTFGDELKISHYDGDRKSSYNSLVSALRNRLKLQVRVSNDGYDIDIRGEKDSLHMASEICRKAAPIVSSGKLLTKVWLENLISDAKFNLSGVKAEEKLMELFGETQVPSQARMRMGQIPDKKEIDEEEAARVDSDFFAQHPEEYFSKIPDEKTTLAEKLATLEEFSSQFLADKIFALT